VATQGSGCPAVDHLSRQKGSPEPRGLFGDWMMRCQKFAHPETHVFGSPLLSETAPPRWSYSPKGPWGPVAQRQWQSSRRVCNQPSLSESATIRGHVCSALFSFHPPPQAAAVDQVCRTIRAALYSRGSSRDGWTGPERAGFFLDSESNAQGARSSSRLEGGP
jgi:hypothetical protein